MSLGVYSEDWLDGRVDRLKARLVVKGYTQVYGFDYYDTSSPVVKIAYVRHLLSMDAMQSWLLYQLDIKKCLLTWRHGKGGLYGATHLGLLLRGSLDWYAGYVVHYMA